MLKNKTVLITGSGSGIGAGIARALGESGAQVVVADIDGEAAYRTANSLGKDGIEAFAIKMDVTDAADIDKAYKAAEKEFGKLDVLVNNAGISMVEDALCIDMKDWDKIFDINVSGLFLCCRQFAQYKKAKGKGGVIVNIASNAAKVCFDGYAHYNASKAAVVNITQSLAKEFAPLGINVNAVCPGAVDTAMLRRGMERAIEGSPDPKPTIEDLRAAWGPPQLGRLIQPIEVGRVVAFLASDAAVIIRGQSISIDGGATPY